MRKALLSGIVLAGLAAAGSYGAENWNLLWMLSGTVSIASILISGLLFGVFISGEQNRANFHSYQTAWSFDLLGEEADAAPYYERAISLGLPDKELEGALLGLGSTYRTLGEYQKARYTLEKGMERFPDNRAMSVFYSMVLYNLGSHGEAMGLLLESLAETSSDEGIHQYRKAILFYADKLDTVWK